MEYGDKVKAYPLDETGPKIGFYMGPADSGDGKDAIQVGSSMHALAYREPQNYDENGPNGTYCSL